MAIGAGIVLALLLAFGVNLGQALSYALILACPIGMAGMMFFMGRGKGHEHGGLHGSHDHQGRTQAAPTVGGGLTREDHERIG